MDNSKEKIAELLAFDGAMAAAIVDYASGMTLAADGTGVDLDAAAAGNTEVVRAKMKTMKTLGIQGGIEDILITLDKQYHIIRPCEKIAGVFIYFVLDKARSNLAMARRKVMDIDKTLAI